MITSANAAELQRKGVESRRLNTGKSEALAWPERELLRVRAHVARINHLMDKTADPQDIMRFAAALRTFYEVAGLPKAGAFRPVSPKTTKTVVGEPLD